MCHAMYGLAPSTMRSQCSTARHGFVVALGCAPGMRKDVPDWHCVLARITHMEAILSAYQASDVATASHTCKCLAAILQLTVCDAQGQLDSLEQRSSSHS